MAVQPTGKPAWTRLNDHTAYGGDVNKRNYQSQDAVNPLTDVTAEQFARLAADLAAVARTAPFATITYTADDTGTNDPNVDDYQSMAGSAPTAARVSDGLTRLTWLASYADPYGVTEDIHIVAATATCHGTTACLPVLALSDPDANTRNERVEVTVRDDAGVLVTDATVTLTIWTGVG